MEEVRVIDICMVIATALGPIVGIVMARVMNKTDKRADDTYKVLREFHRELLRYISMQQDYYDWHISTADDPNEAERRSLKHNVLEVAIELKAMALVIRHLCAHTHKGRNMTKALDTAIHHLHSPWDDEFPLGEFRQHHYKLYGAVYEALRPIEMYLMDTYCPDVP